MSVKFTGFDYISDNDGMGIHVVAGADDIWLPVDDRERVRFALAVLDGLESKELDEVAHQFASGRRRGHGSL
ncbi:hypothetical protein [Bifidobacterium catenulatum]|jgi:hypothetical protein|uniref:Uncharacterized protein n=1 Tax=Bifidobacterium catenulatum subsp. kashiwanohense TaxID=630129 RepID=A0AA43P4N8_9BIFI|nr:hypothetical protein [Bifidobacterium catenulatum]MDH7889180.1 hypothetical protein [Bifidobacterium catenulatum subsp. kashiwanohense]